ncbi:hypothetical protein AURDEDRAFT_34025, partial [Auricularia subglabra TFB-10046 SS5]
TVFEAELVGIWLALCILADAPDVNEAAICLDNQPAIRRAHDPRPKSGQLITDAIVSMFEGIRAQRPSFSLRLVWVPGHEGVDGNELADLHAKRAAAGKNASRMLLGGNPLPHSAGALRARSKQDTRLEWQRR